MNSDNVNDLKNGWLVGYLQDRCNKGGDFKVSTHFPNGSWTQHKSVLWCWENLPKEKWRLEKATNMGSRPCDIFLDFDPEKGEEKVPESKVWEIVAKLREYHFDSFEVYFSGSRGYHFHIVESQLNLLKTKEQRERIRLFLMKKLGADTMLKTESHLIPIPNVPHWKTGNLKKLIFKYPKCH